MEWRKGSIAPLLKKLNVLFDQNMGKKWADAVNTAVYFKKTDV